MRIAILAAALIAACAVYLTTIRNPQPKGDDAAIGEFSALRAMEHLEAIARAPRPWTDNQAARDYIVAALSNDGLKPEIQAESSVITRNRPLYNVALRIAGRKSSGAIVLTAHYDTMAQSPGAGDDGSGTVILMELARAVATGTALDNDVIIVLTDAEEFGLIGAISFAASHPWMRDARLAINLEGITAGPPVMWRMGKDQGWTARLLASARSGIALTPYLFAGSPMGDTDFTAFALKGMPGYDLFTAYSYPNNHSMEDLPEGIDPGSVQRAGDVLLRLTRSLGDADLSSTPAVPDMVYFNFFRAMVYYPRGWIPAAGIFASLLAAAAVGLSMRRRLVSWRGLAAGAIAALAALAAVPFLITVLWLAIEQGSLGSALSLLPSTLIALIRPHDWPHSPNDAWRYVGYLALATLLATACLRIAKRRAGAEELFAGALAAWSALTLATAFALPEANYLLLWPLLPSSLSLLLAAAPRPKPRARAAVAAMAVFLAFVLILPALYFLYLATGLGTLPLTAMISVLIAIMVLPHFDML